jgi:hypothetical protein
VKQNLTGFQTLVKYEPIKVLYRCFSRSYQKLTMQKMWQGYEISITPNLQLLKSILLLYNFLLYDIKIFRVTRMDLL